MNDKPPGDCERCPLGSSCLGPITFSQVKAKFGWQQCTTNLKKFARCSFSGACLGGPNPALKGKVNDSKLGDPADCQDCHRQGANPATCSNCTERCNDQYVNSSRLCGQCAPGYSLDGLGGRCQKCPDPAQNIAISVVGIFSGLLFLFVFVRLTLSDGGDLDASDGVKSIGMSYVQLLSLLVTFQIQWPKIFIDIFRVGGAITAVGQHLVNLKCMFPHMSEAEVFFSSKIMSAVAPFVLVTLCVVTWYLVDIFYRIIQCSEGHPSRWRSVPFFFEITNLSMKMKSSCVSLLYLLWPTLCSETFSLFACRSVCEDDVTYLRADLKVVCWHGDHAGYVYGVGVPMMLLYVIGFPTVAWYRVWRVQQAARAAAAEAGAEEETVDMVAMTTTMTTTMTTMTTMPTSRQRRSSFHYNKNDVGDDHLIYGMFFSAFREKTWWWESTIAGRKIGIAMIGVFGENMESMQVQLTLVLVMFILLITAQVRPFGGAHPILLQRLEIASLAAIFLTIWAAAVFNVYPKCQDPKKPEGQTLAWCNVLSVTIGAGSIVLVFVFIGIFIWLKMTGGGDDVVENEDDSRGQNMMGAVVTAVRDQMNWFQARMMSEEQRQTRARARTVDAADNNVLENPAMVIEMTSRSTSAGEVKVVEEGEI